MNTAVIGIGSNIEAERNIAAAISRLERLGRIAARSRFVRTAPVGVKDQPNFLNGAVLLITADGRTGLLARLKAIEDALGRDRAAPKFGPRTIDLDIVVWNGEVVDDDYYSRDFLQNAVKEIVPDIKFDPQTDR